MSITRLGFTAELKISGGISLLETNGVCDIMSHGNPLTLGKIRVAQHARLKMVSPRSSQQANAMHLLGGMKEDGGEEVLGCFSTIQNLDGTNLLIKTGYHYSGEVEGHLATLMEFDFNSVPLTEKDSLEMMSAGGRKSISLKTSPGLSATEASSVLIHFAGLTLTAEPGKHCVMIVEDYRSREHGSNRLKIQFVPKDYLSRLKYQKGDHSSIDANISIRKSYEK